MMGDSFGLREESVLDVCGSMTYMMIEPEERRFEWDQWKSHRNQLDRGLPFELAVLLFERPTLEQPDLRFDYDEDRTLAIGMVGQTVLVCVYTDRSLARRIISLRPANRRERDVYCAAFQN